VSVNFRNGCPLSAECVPAEEFEIKGQKRLEYRGYDSAGIATRNEEIQVVKAFGKVATLEEKLLENPVHGSIGMGHTRWATHGEPNDLNAHPHTSNNGQVVLIHNGIIENYQVLKQKLQNEGYTFQSETDTEVLVNWIEYIYNHGLYTSFSEALSVAISQVEGAFGLVVMTTSEKEKLYATRRGSPLVIGVGKDEYFLASDATPIVEYTKRVFYLEDDDLVVLTRNKMELKKVAIPEERKPQIQEIEMDVEAIEKGGYDYFMEKEIFEQPRALRDTMRGRVSPEFDNIQLGGLAPVIEKLKNVDRLIIISCGTSWHAGLLGEYVIEQLARIPVEVEYASEFRYREPVIHEKDAVLAITQSGETADTLAALRLAREAGATVLGVCNVVGSSIARETDAGVYTHAGPEIGVASTKAFTTQLAVMEMIGILLAKERGTITDEYYTQLVKDFDALPGMVEQALEKSEQIETIAEQYKDANNALFLGRGIFFPIALEGALKLKEISYIHAEGYPAAEMKHGPIALIDEQMPVVFVATRHQHLDKTISNMQEVKARKGQVIAIVTEGETAMNDIADHTIEITATSEILSPILAVLPLQLLSYHIAVKRGCNVDQPRNLAKSVTVE